MTRSPDPKAKVTLTCAGCGDSFQVWRHRQDTAKFCSKECANRYMPTTHHERRAGAGARITLICKSCGSDFLVKPYRARKGALYCSRACKDADKKRETRTCHCGVSFVVYPSSGQKFCSLECAFAGRARSSEPELSLKPYLVPRGYVCTNDNPLYFTRDGRTRVPDYVNPSERKIIEVFGEYWHRDRKLPDGTNHETPEECVTWYAEIGWECRVVWTEELEEFVASLEGLPETGPFVREKRPPMTRIPKTHCVHGHPLSGDNLRIDSRGIRRCKRCWADTVARYRAKKRRG